MQRVMTTEYASAFSRRDAPEVCKIIRPTKKRAQGMPGACCTRGLVCKSAKKAHTSIQVQLEQSGIPCAMVLRLIPRSPRRRIPLASVAGGLKDCRNPVGLRQTSASLTPATGARTTRFCRTQLRQSSARCVRSRTKARPANTTTRPTLPRPPQPAPTFVTMANAPLAGRDGGSCRGDLGSRAKRNIFAARLDWQHHVDLAMKIGGARTRLLSKFGSSPAQDIHRAELAL